MCGILGEIRQNEPLDRSVFKSMCNALSHRGPDAEGQVYLAAGKVALGHRRLSIIDLSPAANQPMSNDSGTTWVTFNGEIYNFWQLRKELDRSGHIFRSRSDTEVILHAYDEWGIDCVKRFRGIFAFGLWDEKKHSLFLARDQLGVKPLYYYHDGQRLIFASELKAILSDPRLPRQVRHDAISDYLTYGYVPFDKSILENIWKLPAGHYLKFSEGALSVQQYWDVAYTGDITDEQEALRGLKEALQEAVECQLVSDVPVGVLLSGGIDSSGVAALMAGAYAQTTQTFTIGFDAASHDESEYARLVASFLHTLHTEKQITYRLARDLVDSFVTMYDEPFFDSSGIPTYLLSQVARSKVKVALSGDGGDEVFAGYQRYDRLSKNVSEHTPGLVTNLAAQLTYPMLHRLSPFHWRIKNLGKRAGAIVRDPVRAHFESYSFLNREAQLELLSPGMREYIAENDRWLYQRFWRDDIPRTAAAQYVDLKTYLVDDILVKVDRASMAVGLEVRVPLLDHQLVEFAFRIASSLIYKRGERKYLLKQALRDRLPPEILSSRKRGFSVPMNSWFQMGLKDRAEEVLMDGSLVNRSIFRADQLKKYLKLETPERIWLILVLELWSRRWLEGEHSVTSNLAAI